MKHWVKLEAIMQAQNGTNTDKTQEVPAQFMNGWLSSLDGRLALARELRQRYDAFTDDLGGADRLSYAQRSLCERALWLEYWLSQQEQTLAAGGEFAPGQWIQACNSLQGIFSRLGLERRAKDVPNLQDWIARKTREKAEAAS